MKRLWVVVLITGMLVLGATPVLAANITNAIWQGIIRVTNAGDATYSIVSTNMTLDSDSFAADGLANAALNDIAVLINGTDTAFMPGYDGNPWIIYVPTINAGVNVDYDIYSGNVTGGKTRYFPNTGGMTTTDSASLELGDNCSIEIKGLINTDSGADKNLVDKPNAFKIFVSPTVSGNITASIYPDFPSSINQAAQNSFTSLVTGVIIRAGQRIENYPAGTVEEARFYLCRNGNPAGTAYVRLRAVSDDSIIGTLGSIDVTTLSVTPTFTWYNFTTDVVNPTTQHARIVIEHAGADAANCVRVGKQTTDVDSYGQLTTYVAAYTDTAGEDNSYYISQTIDPTYSVTATGVTSGEHTIRVTITQE